MIFSVNNIVKYISVYIASIFKFIGGIIIGTAEELSFVEVAIFTFLGAMTAVVIVVLFGNTYRTQISQSILHIKTYFYLGIIKTILKWNLFPDSKRTSVVKLLHNRITPKKFTKTIRLLIVAWKKFGIIGIAALTPILLSPIGGAVIAVSFRVKARKIFLTMAIAHLACAFLFAFFFVEFKDFLENTIGIEFHKRH